MELLHGDTPDISLNSGSRWKYTKTWYLSSLPSLSMHVLSVSLGTTVILLPMRFEPNQMVIGEKEESSSETLFALVELKILLVKIQKLIAKNLS